MAKYFDLKIVKGISENYTIAPKVQTNGSLVIFKCLYILNFFNLQIKRKLNNLKHHKNLKILKEQKNLCYFVRLSKYVKCYLKKNTLSVIYPIRKLFKDSMLTFYNSYFHSLWDGVS